MSETPTPKPYQPWFSRRPSLALVGVAMMFVLITTLRIWLGNDATVGVTLLYVVPTSLSALAWGRVAGLIAASVSITLMALWVMVAAVDLNALGWAARIVPILLAGLLLGDASDRLRRAEAARLLQRERDLLHRQAVEVNDSLLQGMAAAKWALESGNVDLGLNTLNDTIETGQILVSRLIRDSSMGPTD